MAKRANDPTSISGGSSRSRSLPLRSRPTRWLLAALTAASLVAPPATALADDEVTIEAGFEDTAARGREYPVVITVSVDSLFVGDLRVRGDSGEQVIPVEIAGGTTREFRLVLESDSWSTVSARAELVDRDGEVVAQARARPVQRSNTDLVGVFPTLARRGLPESIELPGEMGRANLLAFDPETLDLGHLALRPIDIFVVTATDLGELEPAALDSLMTWVHQGGRLLIDESIGTRLPGLPALSSSSTTSPQLIGLGEVWFVDGAAARGAWQEILEPAPTRSSADEGDLGSAFGFWYGEPLSWTLGNDSGFGLPSAAWMALLFALYVLVAGPLTWLLLRFLGRPDAAWVVVPAVAVAFAGFIWIIGTSARAGVEVVHATVLNVAERGSVARTFELHSSRSGDEVTIVLPPQWQPVTSRTEWEPQRELRLSPQADGAVAVTRELVAGSFTLLGSVGPTPDFDDAIRVEARSTAMGVVEGQVTNLLEIDLHDVAVFADQAGVRVGTVPAGETVEYVVRGAVANPMQGEPIEFRVWPAAQPRDWFDGFGPAPRDDDEESAVTLALLAEVAQGESANQRPVGSVMVAGWTTELASPRDPLIASGRTLLVTFSSIDSVAGTVTDVGAPRRLVRGGDGAGREFRAFDFWGGAGVVAFGPFAEVAADSLVLSVPRAVQRLEVLVDGTWQLLETPDRGRSVIALPSEALDAHGRIYAKVLVSLEFGFSWRDLSVRTVFPDDEVAPFVATPARGTADSNESVGPGDPDAPSQPIEEAQG